MPCPVSRKLTAICVGCGCRAAPHRARGDAELTALRHRLSRIESQVQERLFKLRAVGHEEGQVGRQVLHQADALLSQLVTRQQGEVGHEPVAVHGGQLGLAVPRQVEDLFHDAVQVVHLLPMMAASRARGSASENRRSSEW
jgi:hypothetical protein